MQFAKSISPYRRRVEILIPTIANQVASRQNVQPIKCRGPWLLIVSIVGGAFLVAGGALSLLSAHSRLSSLLGIKNPVMSRFHFCSFYGWVNMHSFASFVNL